LPFATIEGISTRYDIVGSGPPILMLSPGGFDATIEKWTTQGIYAHIKPVEHLSRQFTCIVFDRRECGESGGRVEPLSWMRYAVQGKGLLDYLKIDRAHVMGACMGCSPAMAMAVAYPGVVSSLTLYWPVGGAHYRISSYGRFAEHLKFVQEQGLAAVVALAESNGKPFNQDTRGGPWASVIHRDPGFARAYARQKLEVYRALVSASRDTLFDRDTAPGARPEDLLKLNVPTLIVPGRDRTHATSAARYLEECIPNAQYWNALPEEQTAATAPVRLLDFLQM
jgi:pimeloyl-ACP methyl ester carboxylesterase